MTKSQFVRALLKTRVSGLACLVVGLVILAILHLIARPAPPHPWFEGFKKPIILAHQGGNLEWPSSTMIAFEHARETGSDVLDLDLHMTRDKVLVLIHDTTVQRTTDGQGAVADMTWSELEKLDAAYNFTIDAKSFALRGKGHGIPRLVDVLDAFPDWKLQIEVKKAPLEIAPELARVIDQYKAQDRILLSCFDEEMMDELRLHCPDVATSATPAEIRNFILASLVHLEGIISPDYQALQIPLQASGWDLVTPRTVQAARKRGVWVLPWTIDEDADLEVCRQAGVDGFNTNLPTKMEKARANWYQLEKPLFSAP